MSKIDLAVLKEQLNILKTEDSTLDQKFVNAFSDIFSSTTFTIAKAKTFIKGQEKKLLENNLELHRAFEDMSSKIAMAFELSFEKNKKQIEIYQKEADKIIKAANKEFNQKRLQTNKVIESKKQVLVEKLSHLQKEFDQNVYELNQEINKIKNDANIISKRLEDDFANKKAVVENQYESLVTKYSDETIQQKNNANLIIDNLKTT